MAAMPCGLGLKLFALLGGTYIAYPLARPLILRVLDTSDEELADARKPAGSSIEPPA